MNTYECLCEDYVSPVNLSTELWASYISGNTKELTAQSQYLKSDEYWEYNFTILCLIHVMEGGTFE